jgi:molybdopterin-dependent oxidoreductase alpha subunit
MKPAKTGGGWQAIRYSLSKARQAGGLWKLYRAMRSKNACKTCALGMGGQRGGMVNEAGHFPEVCKKSLQAMVADMQGAIRPEFWREYPLNKLRQLSPRELESCGRLVQPVVFSPGAMQFEPIDWDAALCRIAMKLAATPADETFFYFSGRSSNEAGFLLQLFARLYGTNNVNNCSYYCHQASGVGLSSVTGSGTATIVLEDLDQADVVFVIGGNPASNHPRLMRSLMQVRRRGGHVIVINPVVEPGLVKFSVPSDVRSLFFGSEIASQYVQPDIGGDLALFTGVAKRIEELGAVHESFLADHCHGWPELREKLRAASWSEITSASGVEKAEIDEIASRYAAAKNVIFSWTMGITHHEHGVKNVQAIANLALMRGMVGRPGAGLLPIRGHSNVQGIGSVGVTPKLKDAVFERLQSHFGVRLPTTPGRDTMDCIEGAHRGELSIGFCLGGNLFGSNPDAAFAEEALAKLDMIVYLSTTLNTGHVRGLAKETIILPVLARDEEPQPTTQESMFNFIRLSDGGPRRHEGPRSEVEVIAEVAEDVRRQSSEVGGQRSKGRTETERHIIRNPQSQIRNSSDLRPLTSDLSSIDWQSMRNTGRIREAIARIVPGFEQLAEIDHTKEEFQIGGRTFHAAHFATPDGRARMHVHDLLPLAGEGKDELRLMTVRSEGQFNTVVYEDYDLYRGIDRRDVILLHSEDIERLGLANDQRVTVHGPAGRMTNIVVKEFDLIKPGNALMYYPEANVLISRRTDSQSKTPAFKGVVVRVEGS